MERQRLWGAILLLGSATVFFLLFYASVLSKLASPLLPSPALVRNDWYYCLLIPLTGPVLIVVIYAHWLSMKLFKHA